MEYSKLLVFKVIFSILLSTLILLPSMVSAQGVGFIMTVSPLDAKIIQGETKAVTLTITAPPGFTTPIVLSTTNLPTGITVSFNPASITPHANSMNSTVTIAVSKSVEVGSYEIAFVGISGQSVNSAKFTINVEAFSIIKYFSTLFIPLIVIFVLVIVVIVLIRYRRPKIPPKSLMLMVMILVALINIPSAYAVVNQMIFGVDDSEGIYHVPGTFTISGLGTYQANIDCWSGYWKCTPTISMNDGYYTVTFTPSSGWVFDSLDTSGSVWWPGYVSNPNYQCSGDPHYWWTGCSPWDNRPISIQNPDQITTQIYLNNACNGYCDFLGGVAYIWVNVKPAATTTTTTTSTSTTTTSTSTTTSTTTSSTTTTTLPPTTSTTTSTTTTSSTTTTTLPPTTSTTTSTTTTTLPSSCTNPIVIDIKREWNMISIPYKSYTICENTCGELAPTCPALSIIFWEAITKQWVTVSNFNDMKYDRGYWIYSCSPCQLKLDVSNGITASDLVTNYPTWNLIGSLPSSKNVNDIKGSCTISQPLKYFDSNTQTWTTTYTIDPFKAYWFYTDSQCKFSS